MREIIMTAAQIEKHVEDIRIIIKKSCSGYQKNTLKEVNICKTSEHTAVNYFINRCVVLSYFNDINMKLREYKNNHDMPMLFIAFGEGVVTFQFENKYIEEERNDEN